MSIYTFNRYELKYAVNESILPVLVDIIKKNMSPDSHGEKYKICNIYYDTDDYYYIRKSLSKPAFKEKLRIRAYGDNITAETPVFIEIKKKLNGLVNKRRIKLPLQQAYDFLKYPNPSCQIGKELAVFIDRQKFIPQSYISYDRIAYNGNKGGLRISFDNNIITRRFDVKLENGSYGHRLPAPGDYVMEIKTSASVPLWLCSLLTKYKLYPLSFSKYEKEWTICLIQSLKLPGQEQLQSVSGL